MSYVTLKNVTIEYPIFNITARSLKKDLIKLGTGGKLTRDEDRCVVVKALDDVSIHLQDGDRVGLIGHNGAGKSTLLRVLARIYEPTHGEIDINGQVSPLLELMTGMNHEATGYENIVLCGILRGLTHQEIKKEVEAIAEFTDLGDYLHMPIRTYSSGMNLRLAFGIATSISPEILVIDEVVGAGDNAFMEKANARFNELVDDAHIVVLAAHNRDVISRFCNKVIWLQSGKLAFFGDCEKGLHLYENSTP